MATARNPSRVLRQASSRRMVTTAIAVVLTAASIFCVVGAAELRAQAKRANVVYYEPRLPMSFSDVIHPYAWAHQRPDPHYMEQHTAYSVANTRALASFLETQTQVTMSRRGIFSNLFGTNKDKPSPLTDKINHPEVDQRGLFYSQEISNARNPAVDKIDPLKPMPSDFKTSTDMKQATGAFPGERAYRRAVYGTRRRRIPYAVAQGVMASVNPFRRPNNFFNSPTDLMALKDPFFAAKHPEVYDLGKQTQDRSKLPYGGYSSFSNHMTRKRIAERGMNAFDNTVLVPSAPPAAAAIMPVPSSPLPVPMMPVARNMLFHSDGTPIPAYHPTFAAPPAFIPADGTYKFYDFYGSSGSSGSSASAGGAAPPAAAPPASAAVPAAAAPPAQAA